MQSQFVEYIYVLLIIIALVMFANRAKLAYPIVLVLGGLALSFVSRFSAIIIDPEMVFLIFLPPLLYEAAWQVSWKEFWKWRRVITSFAFPIVILTSCVVALVSVALIPGFTLALGFLLGGIISPPDAISATTIMKQVKAPRQLLSIAEGESLLNDASSLVVFRFAVAAVITGQFHFMEVTTSFFLVVFAGILIGLAVGAIFYCIHRWMPVTASMEVALTFITPYCMYYLAEHFHFSGVLAVVSGGLFLSSQRQTILTYESRIQSITVWSTIVFIMNGIVFLLIGLQLPSIIQQLGDISVMQATWYGLAISGVLIVTRLACALGASGFTIVMSRYITVAQANPGWRLPFILGWAGMRGVVSLAAALSIPLLLSDGTAFPFRNLILFISFIVILVTLVFQGLTLPLLIKLLKVRDEGHAEKGREQERSIQKKIAESMVSSIEKKYSKELKQNQFVTNLHARVKTELTFFNEETHHKHHENKTDFQHYQAIYLNLLEEERELLKNINCENDFEEELIRKYLGLMDVEELRTRERSTDIWV
jgi:Na+/H+ antiporter